MKRTKQWAKPPAKRTASDIIPFKLKDRTYGAGYNPKVVAPIPRMIRAAAEKKWFDYSGLMTSGVWTAHSGLFPTYAAVPSLNLIPQGDTGYERNGKQIQVYKLTIRGTCEMDRQSNAVYNAMIANTTYFRWMIYIDTQCNGAAPGLSDLFEENPTNLDQFDMYNSLFETGRFKTLMDKFIRVPEATATYDGTNFHIPSRIVHFKKTFTMNLPILYGDQYANMASELPLEIKLKTTSFSKSLERFIPKTWIYKP